MKFKSIHVSDNSGKTASPAIALPSTQMHSDTLKCILVDGYAIAIGSRIGDVGLLVKICFAHRLGKHLMMILNRYLNV